MSVPFEEEELAFIREDILDPQAAGEGIGSRFIDDQDIWASD